MKILCWTICLLGVFLEPLFGENILLISIDTLRADHLSCYGYQANRTPAIDRWAAEGFRFERAYSEYPLTLPAHSTLLTGTYPLHHGVRENVGFALAAGQVTLAEVLRRNGYATAGFIGSYVLASQFGVARGFDTFDDDFGIAIEKVNAATALRRPAEMVTDGFLTWLGKNRPARFFVFLHFYDPHAPCPDGYDTEVSRVDRNIGRIDEFLRGADLLGKTHIFLVSDHGESLGEHGESGHGFFLYDSTLHIPLIVRPAGGHAAPPGAVKQAASLADVMPTILQSVGISLPANLQGRNLLPLMTGKDVADRGMYAETYVPQLQFGWSPLRSFRLGRYVYVDAPHPEFYDTDSDPRQNRNVVSQNQALSGQYRARLLEFVSKHQRSTVAAASSTPGPEVRERLASLGYVQMTAARSNTGFGQGTDPKDRIAVFETYHEILYRIGAGRVEPSVLDRIGGLRKSAPEVKSLDFLEARTLEALGRIPEALQKYLHAVEIEPANGVARAGYANLLLRAGRTSQAEEEFRIVVDRDPEDYRSRSNLAGIYAMEGKPDAALEQLRLALKTRPGYASGWHNLGQLYLHLKNTKEAETALRMTVKLDRNDAMAHFWLAQILESSGRKNEAADHLSIALKLDPGIAGRVKAAPRKQP